MVADYDSAFGHYRIEDEIYNGRLARVLYGGNKLVAQSGLARDDNAELLFDYNERFRELVRGVNPKRVLVLGGGVLTLPVALNREFTDLHIDVVERDGLLIELAEKYFGYLPNDRMTIYIGDGVSYLADTEATYDLIIMDVFDEARIPPAFLTPAFMRHAYRHTSRHGLVAINCIASLQGRNSTTLRTLRTAVHTTFPVVELFCAARDVSEWMSENYLVIGHDGSHELSPYLLRPPVKLPTRW